MAVAKGVGTVQFLAVALLVIGTWFLVNGVVPFVEQTVSALGDGGQFDPAPWILLNLVFSFEAFFTGSLVIIAARASAIKDEEREAAEAKHREEIAIEHSRMLSAVADLLDANTAGGLRAVLDRIDELETQLIHNGHRAEPPREPPSTG